MISIGLDLIFFTGDLLGSDKDVPKLFRQTVGQIYVNQHYNTQSGF